MTIYYGKFLKASKFFLEVGFYYKYFNSEEAVYAYRDWLRELNVFDVLERIGIAEFNEYGILIENEKTEKILYDPNEEYNKENDENEDEDDEDED